MRYNIYNDEFQVRIDSDNIEGITFNEDYKIEVYKSTFIPSAYDFKNKRNLKGYFILLADGSNKLLLKKTTHLHAAQTAKKFAISRLSCKICSQSIFLCPKRRPQ